MLSGISAGLRTAVLVLAYFVVLTPVALLRRWLARDALGLGFEAERDSYWTPRDKAPTRDSLRDQF